MNYQMNLISNRDLRESLFLYRKGVGTMNIECFKQLETRKTIRGKCKTKNISIQILNYTDELYDKWKVVIGNIYSSGNENFIMSDKEITDMFEDFTNVSMSIDELNDILENPNHTFSTVFRELQCVMNEMIVRYLQEKQLEMINLKRTLEETNAIILGNELDEIIGRLANSSQKLGGFVG